MPSIECRVVAALDPSRLAELAELYAEAEFADSGDDFAWLAAMLAGSMLCVGAFTENGRLVGFARAIGDGASDAYLQDVAVKKEFRGCGVGGKLVGMLTAELHQRGVDWIGLVATPGNAGFYRKLGFKVMENFTPMKWTGAVGR